MSKTFSLYSHAAIIAPKSRHDDFLALKKEDPHLDFELYTLEDLEAMFAYRYDERALEAVYHEVGDEEKASAMLLALSHLNAKKSYLSSKLEALKRLQEKLISAHLLYCDPNPERSFEGKSVVISGYQDTERISAILGELHNMAISYDAIEKPDNPLREAYEFKDVYDELHDVFNRMAADLASGTPIDDLYLLGVDPSYYDLVGRFGKEYGFQVATPLKRPLYDSALYHAFRPQFALEGEKSLQILLEKSEHSKDAATLYRLFRRFLALGHDENTLRHFFDEILKKTYAEEPSYQHVVHLLEGYIPPKNAHVYFISCQMGAFPPIAAEGDYLTDSELAELSLPTSEDLTHEWAAELSALLDSSELRYLSYKKKAFGAFFFPSGLLEEKGFKITVSPLLPYEYSHDKEALLEASLRDDEVNYLRVDKRLNALKKGCPIPDYRSFDYTYHPFAPVNPKEPRSYSPTQLKKFYGCPYSYYLERILDIEENDTSFLSRVGTIFHAVMKSLYATKDFNFETAWTEAVAEEEKANGVFSAKENALFLRLKEECSYAVNFYQSHDSLLIDPSYRTEEPFALVSAENPLVSFKGQFDKIVSFGKEKRYFAVIDYKTGGERFNEKLLPYGLSMQLPYYAYYAMHDPAFENQELIGLFIGPILSGQLVKDVQDSLESFNSDKFKLEGVFAKDIDKMLLFDPSAMKSEMIRSLSYGKNGFSKAALTRAKSPEEFAALAESAKTLTLAADQKIRAGDFPVAPLNVKGKFDACANCSFRDVCYRKDEAVKHIDGETPTNGDEEESEDETNGLE
jgi:CRISPR/Cas system-associated exonuclease Cas4 (RecB family)